MPAVHNSSESAAYRPTSLDFINLPNPIEPNQPHSGSQKHPLNGTPRLEKAHLGNAANQDLFRLILDPASERSTKRRKETDSNLLDLPKLPVRNAPKRPRIPPTLSGLHQPPPDAGLLPSINFEQPQAPPPRPNDQVVTKTVPKISLKQEGVLSGRNPVSEVAAIRGLNEDRPKTPKKRTKRRKWTDEETEFLLQGVSRFGIGSWTQISKCADYTFQNRTAVDLKDRFRVCCPESYKAGGTMSTTAPSFVPSDEEARLPSKTAKGPPCEKISATKLSELGICEPFTKAKRRPRHGYTPEEDDSLLRGYEKYGNSWALIRQDKSLNLSHRKAADLRDRFRTRYPGIYTKASSSSFGNDVENLAKSQENMAETVETAKGDALLESDKTAASTTAFIVTESNGKEDVGPVKASTYKRSDQPSLFTLDDLFLGVPYGAEDENSSQIILDRGILDWATGDTTKVTLTDQNKSHGIDPLMTLKLPKPVTNVSAPHPGVPASVPQTTTVVPLPSLANLLPEMVNSEQLGLPSLMQWISASENEARGSTTHIPTLEELLGS